MGVCSAAGRVTICHKNTANMITKFTATFGDLGINIENMMNKSKGDYAYTMLDVAAAVNDDQVKKLEAIDGVIKVRVVKQSDIYLIDFRLKDKKKNGFV